MEIDQLRHFLKVAEMANFTKAAQVVGLSQPALSRSIARLEEELGQPILDRQTRQVVLTEAGELLAERAKQIIALADDTRAQITDDGQTGRIRLASIPTIAPYFLPGLLREFSNAHSKATVLVREDTTANLLHMLAEGEIDIAILARPIDMKYLQVTDLFEEELLLVLPAGHSLAQKKTVRVEDIDKEPFVLLGEAHCLTDNIVSFCRQKSFFPVTIERTSQIVTIQELVALGHGISMVPAMACTRQLSAPNLQVAGWPQTHPQNSCSHQPLPLPKQIEPSFLQNPTGSLVHFAPRRLSFCQKR